MRDETTLLPCPFCEGEARICAKHYTNGISYVWIECGRCHARSRHSDSIEDLILAWNARQPSRAFETEAEAIAAWNTRATHGTLTAEQVKRINKIIEKHWHDLPSDYDMPEATALPQYSYDWQAIADELNAAMGGGECEFKPFRGPISDMDEIGDRQGVCSECSAYMHEQFNYCPNCGKRCVHHG